MGYELTRLAAIKQANKWVNVKVSCLSVISEGLPESIRQKAIVSDGTAEIEVVIWEKSALAMEREGCRYFELEAGGEYSIDGCVTDIYRPNKDVPPKVSLKVNRNTKIRRLDKPSRSQSVLG